MMTFRILRHCQCKKTNALPYKYVSQAFCSDSDNEGKKEKKPAPLKGSPTKKSEEALAKLNLLLKQMVQEEQQMPSKSQLNLAKPKGRSLNAKLDTTSEKESTDVIQAAKDVAKAIGGDVKQTESELLSKLLGSVAKNDMKDPQNKSTLNLSDVLAGMKIDRTVQPSNNNETSRAHQVRQLLDRGEIKQGEDSRAKRRETSRMRPRMQEDSRTNIEPIDLFGSKPLGIFTNNLNKVAEKQVTLKTWDRLTKRELDLAVTHPPENYFQEMILWTKQGKLWKFPIDNEYGLDEEHKVYFAEHIFLEKHLEPWCPSRGPVRHFMELVCVGLSKNPYLTADAKQDHINWYKEYFTSKEQLLKEVGALPAEDKVHEKDV